jgi:hypothetical protein
MKQRALAEFVVSSVVGGALLVAACSGRSISRGNGTDDDTGGGGTAGTIDRGGTSGTGGTTPRTRPTGGTAGSTFPTGGGGTSGSGGAGITSGSGGVAPSCDVPGGPLATPSVRRTVPFVFTPWGGTGGAGGAPNEASDLELSGAGGGGGELDGCERLAYGWECMGEARAMTGGGALMFTFNDTSTLAWAPGAGTFVAAPRVVNGERIYITYQQESPPVCAFCGNSSQTLIEISRRGETIWYGSEGSLLEELNVNFARFLLGATYRRQLACVVPPFAVDCYVVERQLYDVVLETVPEQWIPFATPTVISTPEGEFEVMWASSEQAEYRDPGCDDGRMPSRDRGFAMSRL